MTEAVPAPTIEEIVADAEILDINFLELSARRFDDENELSEGSGADSDDPETIEPSHLLQTGHRKDDKGFRVRIRTEIPLPVGTVVSDIAVEYTLNKLEASTVSPEVMLDFVNRVATMALVPYLRESVASVTRRVFGNPLTMPMIKAGDLWFSQGDALATDPATRNS